MTPRRRYRIDVAILHVVVRDKPNHTVVELTRAYNEQIPPDQHVPYYTFLRALRREGYRFIKSYPGPQNVAWVMNAPLRAKRKERRLARLRLLVSSRR